jgi:hypothetical protein
VYHITVPHTPQQKDVAERKNRTAFKNARSRLQDAGLGKKYWAEVVSTTTYVLKETFAHYSYEKHDPTRSLDRQEGLPNTYSSLEMQNFCFPVHVPDEKNIKWDPRSREYVFTLYLSDTNGYRLVDLETPQKSSVQGYCVLGGKERQKFKDREDC